MTIAAYYRDDNCLLLRKWQALGAESLIYDGIVSPSHWFASDIKILVIMKEAYGGGFWNIAEQISADDGILKVGGTASQGTQNRLAEWVFAIRQGLNNSKLDIESEKAKGYFKARKYMLEIAYVNLKKINGNNTSSDTDIKTHVSNYKYLLKEQIELIKPNMILCGGTFHFIDGVLIDKCQPIAGLQNCYHNSKYTVLSTYHPAARNAHIVAEELYQKAKKLK
ncbi:hypothetical protein ACXR6G_18410 [Ancylomarina sp. YFZ004]